MRSGQEGNAVERQLAEGCLDYASGGKDPIENFANSAGFLRKGRGLTCSPRIDIGLRNRRATLVS